MLVIDHVIYGVRDLDAASRRFIDELGLPVQAGGSHPGGTKNAAIQCRDGAYVELLAVEDPSGPLGMWLQNTLADGDRLVGWAVRTDDIDADAARLDVPIQDGSIEMPDGTIGTWRLAGIEAIMSEPWLPFFIQYSDARDDARPDPAEDAPPGIAWLEVCGDASKLSEWLGGAELAVRLTDGHAGLKAVGLRTSSGGEVVVR